MAKSKGSLLPLILLGGGAAALALLGSKPASAAPPAPPVKTLPASPGPDEPPSLGTVTSFTGKSGKTWEIDQVGSNEWDVFSPADSFGPHERLRVVRYTHQNGKKVLSGIAAGVPSQVAAAAMSDLGIEAAAPTVMAPPGRPPMPESLQREMAEVMAQLGVDNAGTVKGPVSVEGVRHATELASRLEQSGYPEAGALIRGYATAATRMIPLPAASIPASAGIPADLLARVQRALQLERDPAKLEAILAAMKTLPQSPQRDLLIASLSALILQVRTAQETAKAATDIDQMLQQPGLTTSPGLPTASRPPATPAKPAYVPPSVSTLPTPASPRLLRVTYPLMRGTDVLAWQGVLNASGYNVTLDGIYGPGTFTATKDWQGKRGLPADGVVGPATLAKVGTAATASVPAASKPSVPTVLTPRILKLTSPYMSGSDVLTWQGVLKASGYAVSLDGVYGPGTLAATKDWQSKRNLTADGIVGPATLARVGTPPTAPVSLPKTPVPQAQPTAKSPREIAADAMVTHLLALQRKYGVKASKGKQDTTLVKRFQREVGGVADGLPGPNTLIAAARAGVGLLPKVMFWNKSPALSQQLSNYRAALGTIAANAAAAGMPTLAAQISASAAAETGEAA